MAHTGLKSSRRIISNPSAQKRSSSVRCFATCSSPKRSTISTSGDSRAASSFSLRSPYAVHHRSISSRTGRTTLLETGFVVESPSFCQSSVLSAYPFEPLGTLVCLLQSEYPEFVKSRIDSKVQRKSLFISCIASLWAFQCREILPGGCGSKKNRGICIRERRLPRLHFSSCTCLCECRIGLSEMLANGLHR